MKGGPQLPFHQRKLINIYFCFYSYCSMNKSIRCFIFLFAFGGLAKCAPSPPFCGSLRNSIAQIFYFF